MVLLQRRLSVFSSLLFGKTLRNWECYQACQFYKFLVYNCLCFGTALVLVWSFPATSNNHPDPKKDKDMIIPTFFNQPEQLETASLVRQQITTLGSALFFTENESLLKLPVHVINHVQVDEQNRVWFLIQRPTQALTEFDTELPAKLDFFKKGIPYYIKIKGTATIVDNTAKVKELAGDAGNHKELVAVCVTIRTMDHFETAAKPVQSWLQQSAQQLSNLFS